MTTQHFLQVLQDNPGKALTFAYAKDQFVPANFHITEVKNVAYESVDCGGFMHADQFTSVQLWINPNEKEEHALNTSKALKIMEVVEKKKPMRKEKDVFFEYGNDQLPTSNYAATAVEVTDEQVLIKLYAPAASCKPSDLAKHKGLSVSCC